MAPWRTGARRVHRRCRCTSGVGGEDCGAGLEDPQAAVMLGGLLSDDGSKGMEKSGGLLSNCGFHVVPGSGELFRKAAGSNALPGVSPWKAGGLLKGSMLHPPSFPSMTIVVMGTYNNIFYFIILLVGTHVGTHEHLVGTHEHLVGTHEQDDQILYIFISTHDHLVRNHEQHDETGRPRWHGEPQPLAAARPDLVL